MVFENKIMKKIEIRFVCHASTNNLLFSIYIYLFPDFTSRADQGKPDFI